MGYTRQLSLLVHASVKVKFERRTPNVKLVVVDLVAMAKHIIEL